MNEFFIEPEWLAAVYGRKLFYPAAGNDIQEPLAAFRDQIDEFHFCDPYYPQGLSIPRALADGDGLKFVEREAEGTPSAAMEGRRTDDGRSYRFLAPSRLVETYQRDDGSLIKVGRRRGFGQIALSEFSPGSIGVFIHRGDSPGESGSNVYFFSNKKARYEPCGNLFTKLMLRLSDKALVVSDGSNMSLAKLKRRYRAARFEGREQYESYKDHPFDLGGFQWTCIGWLGSQGRRVSLVWGVTRNT